MPTVVNPRSFELYGEGAAQNVLPRAWDRDTRRFASSKLEFMAMAGIVLRIRLIGGDHLDVSYEEPDMADSDEVIEHVISALAQDTGVLRARHGERLVVLFGRGVAAIEVAPRGAIL